MGVKGGGRWENGSLYELRISYEYTNMKIEGKKKKEVHVASRRDQYTIVLEDLRGQFKVFGESLDDVKRDLKAVKKRGDETFEEVGNIKAKITAIKMRLDSIEKRLNSIEKRLSNVEIEIKSLRKGIGEIESCSNGENVHERLNIFEARIGRIEKQLKLCA